MIAPVPPLPRQRRSVRRRLAFMVVALALGLLLALALLELGMRAFWRMPPAFAEFQQAGLYVETASGGTGLTPGYRGTLQVSPLEPITAVRVNALGMRGPEVGPKRSGERRLLVVGDSLVFGFGVEEEETFARSLERGLAAAGREVTVGNGGVSGFNSYDCAQHIADLLPGFDADAVLFCFYLGNDAFENRNREFCVVAGHRFTTPWVDLARDSLRMRLGLHSRFWFWCETWLIANRPEWSLLTGLRTSPEVTAMRAGFPGVPPGGGSVHAGLFLDVVDEAAAWPPTAAPVMPRVLADFRAALQAARAAAGDRPLGVLVLPTRWHLDDEAFAGELQRHGFDPARFRRGTIQRRLRSLCGELALPIWDATPWLEATRDHVAQFVSDGGHFSAAGHALVAEHLLAPIGELLR